jgi:hypothetical protein
MGRRFSWRFSPDAIRTGSNPLKDMTYDPLSQFPRIFNPISNTRFNIPEYFVQNMPGMLKAVENFIKFFSMISGF